MSFDYRSLAKDIGMSDDDQAALAGLFEKNPNAATKLQSVFETQVQTRLAPFQQQLEAKVKELDAQFETIDSIRSGDHEAVAAAERRAETLARERAALEQRIHAIGREAGIDVEAYLKDLTPAPAVAPVTKQEPTVLNQDEIDRRMNRAALVSFEQGAVLADLADEHRVLFGQPMSRVEVVQSLKDLAKRTGNPNVTLRDAWEQKFNVAQRRAEIQEQQTQARIDAEVAKARMEERDKAALSSRSDVPPVFSSGSPIMAALKDSTQSRPATVQGVPEAVAAAIRSHRQQKSQAASAA